MLDMQHNVLFFFFFFYMLRIETKVESAWRFKECGDEEHDNGESHSEANEQSLVIISQALYPLLTAAA